MDNTEQDMYRRMIHELSCGLNQHNCEDIIYLRHLPEKEAQASKSNLPLHVLTCLEAYGHIGPSKLDLLESLLKEIHHEDLLPVVQKYRKWSKEYMKKKKKETRKNTGKAANCSEEQMTDGKKKLRSLYTLLLTHITGLTQVTSIFREELDKIGEEDEGVDQAMERFLKVVEDGDKFTDDLRTVLKDMGIKSNRSSASSVAASELVGTAATTPIQSPSLSSKLLRRKPVPAPRKHLKTPGPLVCQETGIYENVSNDQYKLTYQASSTPKWARRDAESEEDTTAENTGTGDSGIGEWIDPCRTKPEGDSLDPVYTPLMNRKVDSSGYTTIAHNSLDINQIAPQDAGVYAEIPDSYHDS